MLFKPVFYSVQHEGNAVVDNTSIILSDRLSLLLHDGLRVEDVAASMSSVTIPVTISGAPALKSGPPLSPAGQGMLSSPAKYV